MKRQEIIVVLVVVVLEILIILIHLMITYKMNLYPQVRMLKHEELSTRITEEEERMLSNEECRSSSSEIRKCSET